MSETPQTEITEPPKALSIREELQRLSGVIPLEVPGIPVQLYCKYLTMPERIDYESRVSALPEGHKDWMELLVLSALCDEHGNLIYSFDDLDEVRKLPAQIGVQMSVQFGFVNPIAKTAVDDAKKNS